MQFSNRTRNNNGFRSKNQGMISPTIHSGVQKNVHYNKVLKILIIEVWKHELSSLNLEPHLTSRKRDNQSFMKMGFSRKKFYPPPVEDINFFEVDPLEIHVFSSIFGLPPWNSNDFYSTPLEISIDWYPQQEGYNFLSGKAQ